MSVAEADAGIKEGTMLFVGVSNRVDHGAELDGDRARLVPSQVGDDLASAIACEGTLVVNPRDPTASELMAAGNL